MYMTRYRINLATTGIYVAADELFASRRGWNTIQQANLRHVARLGNNNRSTLYRLILLILRNTIHTLIVTFYSYAELVHTTGHTRVPGELLLERRLSWRNGDDGTISQLETRGRTNQVTTMRFSIHSEYTTRCLAAIK